MNQAQQKVVQYLGEAHATEQALTRDLQAQIATAPRGSYRSALEAHLGETRDHASRVRARLDALREGFHPLTAIVGAAESVVGQAVALGKAPLNLLRGSGGEEKLLKNAKDACAGEMLEIATYTSLERLARSVGDDETARLAASIRADEERMYERVLSEIPQLTGAVVPADVTDETREPAAPRAAKKPAGAARRNGLAISGYDTLTAAQIVGRLASLSPRDRASIETHERKHKNRTTILNRIAALRPEQPAVAAESPREPDETVGDLPPAESHLRQAADSGDVHAAHRLGVLLWRERGNPESAVEWLDRAAQADDPAAERDLGILLRDHGDTQGAYHWLSRAADRDGEARHALAELVESH